MKRSWLQILIGVAGLLASCSSTEAPGAGAGGHGGGGAAGSGGTGATSGGGEVSPGACVPGVVNPDIQPGGACTLGCESVACGLPCTVDCCVPCGPNGAGHKHCSCPSPGQPYVDCTCDLAADAKPDQGPCSPQGYATATLPDGAPDGSITLQGASCSRTGIICFTADSTPSAPRACLCQPDGHLHCSGTTDPVNSTGVPTPYN